MTKVLLSALLIPLQIGIMAQDASPKPLRVCSGTFAANGLYDAVPDSLAASVSTCDGYAVQTFILQNQDTENQPFLISQGTSFYEGFEDGLARWTMTGNWGISTEAYSGQGALSDSPLGNYPDNADQSVEMSDASTVLHADDCWLYYRLQVDMECCCDHFRTLLQVNSGGWITLATENCYQSYTLMGYDLSAYVEDGDQIRIRFEFTSDYSINGDGIHLDEMLITSTHEPATWLEVLPESGIIPAGDSVIITCYFEAAGTPAGLHAQQLLISLGDPVVESLDIPVVFTITGVAVPETEQEQLVFQPVQRNAVASQPFTIYNQGCAPLGLDSVIFSHEDFYGSQVPEVIAAYDSIVLLLYCRPSLVGSVSGSCEIYTSAGIVAINLAGEGLPGPLISVIPDNYTVSLQGCNDSLCLPLTVYNTGDLSLHAVIAGSGPVAEPLCRPQTIQSPDDQGIHRVVLQTIDHSSGGSENGYEDFFDSVSTILTPGIIYPLSVFTASPWAQVRAWIDYDNDGDFNMTNELVLNHINETPFEWQPSDNPMDTEISGNILIPFSASQGTWLRLRVVSCGEMVDPPVPCMDIYGQFEDYAVMVNRPLTVSPDSLNIPAGDSAMTEVCFSPAGMPEGNYLRFFRISSNDLSNPGLIVPVSMNITGSPAPLVPDTAFNFPACPEHAMLTDTLEIFNLACGNLSVSEISTGNPVFTVIPSSFTLPGYDSVKVAVRFIPADPGQYEDSLHLVTSAGNYSIPISGTGLPAAHLEPVPAYLSVALTGCHDSTERQIMLYNPGSDTLDYQIIQTVEFSEDFEGDLAGWTHQVFGQDSLWHITSLDSYGGNHSLWCGVEFQGNYATGRRIDNAIVTPPIDLRACNAEDITTLRFMEFYDTESWSDFCRVHISADGGLSWNWLNGQGSSGTNDEWEEHLIDISQYNGNIILIRFYFYTYSSQNNNYPGWFIDNVRVSDTASSDRWLSINPMQGQIPPSDSLALQFLLRNTLVNSGQYHTDLMFLSNSAADTALLFPVSLTTQGSGAAGIPGLPLVFPTVMQYTHAETTFFVHNTGCDTLSGEFSATTQTEFEVNPERFLILLPGDSLQIFVGFYPDTPGMYVDTLSLLTNSGDYLIPVAGETTPPPVLVYEPEQVSLVTGSCADSILVPFVIRNNGLVPLSWEANILYNPPHRALFFNGVNSYVQFGSWNPGTQWTLEAWVNCDSLWSGRKTIYGAVGNCQNWALTLDNGIFGLMIKPRSGACSEILSSGVTPQTDTWYHLAGTCDGDSARIYVNGELKNTAAVFSNYTGYGWNFIGREYNSSVNHFNGTVDELRVWNHARDAAQLEENMHRPLAGNESGLTGYWDMNEVSGYYIIDKSPSMRNGNNLALRVNSEAPVDRYLLFEPSSGIIPAGDSTAVTAVISATYMNSGLTNTNVMLHTNDPLRSYQIIPFQVSVTGEAIIEVAGDSLDMGTVMQFSESHRWLVINNSGCDTLFLTGSFVTGNSFSVVPASLTILPRSADSLRVSFHPLSTGTHTDTLYIPNNDSLLKVSLNGMALPAPHLVVTPDTVQLVLDCPEGTTFDFSISNDGAEILQFSLTGTTLPWVDISALSGNLAPGETQTVPVHFRRKGMNAGIYQTHAVILSNDPRNDTLLVPVMLDILYDDHFVDLGPDTSACEGTFFQLDAGAGYLSYLWSNGSDSRTMIPAAGGTYTVTVTDSNACVSSDTLVFVLYPVAVISLTNDTTLCSGLPLFISPGITGYVPPVPLEAVIGTGNSHTSQPGPSPFGTSFLDDRTQYLYTAGELQDAGLIRGYITSIAFKTGSAGLPAMQGFSIKMGHTVSENLNGFIPGLGLVFDTSVYQVTAGWNTYTLEEPFYWNGNEHIVVEVCFDNDILWGYSSSVQYTAIPGKTWSQYCDNCGPGCNLEGGSGYLHRANARFTAMGENFSNHWTGPSGFESMVKDILIQEATVNHTGMYYLTVENGEGCFSHDSVQVTVIQSPVFTLSGNDSIPFGDTTQLTSIISGGEPPFTYQWSPGEGLSDPASGNPAASPDTSTVYTLMVSGSNQCQSTASISITVLPVYPVTGFLRYANAFFTPLQNATLILKNADGEILESTQSGLGGAFSFSEQVSGTYQIDIQPTGFGGVNATDALEISRHIVRYITLSGLKLKAADVNNSGSISSADPLLILRRTVELLDTFPAGDWTWNPFFSVDDAPLTLQLEALCTGDVNASHIPGMKHMPQVDLLTGGVEPASPEGTITLPLRVMQGMQLGAFSLGLAFPAGLYELSRLTSCTDGVCFHYDNQGILRVAWQDHRGLQLEAGDMLLSLVLRQKKPGPPVPHGITLAEPAEFADPEARIITPVLLSLPAIVQGTNDLQELRLFPNPCSGLIQCRVFLPGSGDIEVHILDILGKPAAACVSMQVTGGAAAFSVNTESLSPGLYSFLVKFKGNTSHFLHQTFIKSN